MAQQPKQQKHALSDAQVIMLAQIVKDAGTFMWSHDVSDLVSHGLVEKDPTRKATILTHGEIAFYVPTPAGRRMDEARRAAARSEN